MQRTSILLLAALLALSAAGCAKVQARAELKKGNSYYQQEQYSKAMDYFKRGLDLDPDATFAWRSLGLSALAMYRPGDDTPKNLEYGRTSIDAFEKYLAEYPNDEKVEDYLMAMYVNLKKYDEALSFIDRRSQERPDEAPKLQVARSNILTQAGRLDKALQLAQALPPEQRSVSLYSIGMTAWDKVFHDPGTMDFEERNKLVDMGIDAVKKAVDAKPDYSEAMVCYGLLLREKAKMETDGEKRLALEQQATDWRNKAIELRKKAQPPAKT
jgi:tetratricopeptide (TPR) repeat protein